MEKNYFDDDDEFESFLKEKADQYKLYPSDKVWNGIHNFFHTYRKWYTLSGVVLLFTTLFFIGLQINPEYPLFNSSSINAATEDVPNNGKQESFTTHLIAIEKPTPQLQAEQILKPVTRPLLSQTIVAKLPDDDANADAIASFIANNPGKDALSETLTPDPSLRSSSLQKTVPASKKQIERNAGNALEKTPGLNWLHELAINRLSLHPLKSHLNLQFYVSPTSGYRTLQHYKADAGSASKNISPLSGDPINIDGIVNHHPATGLELGSALLFNASPRVTFKAGLQFNYVRYAINAYQSYPEKTAITLSSVGHRTPADTITAYSSIRNLGGRYPEELHNHYGEVSLPIGAEFKVLGDGRFQVNIGGSIQPTYVLFNNTYLLTNDYGNYTKDPGLVRKWNVNTALEAYVSYRMGGLRWQLGPQFRYQLLSTYNDLYPIREYLMEYGIKIGVSKTLR